jgi:hypothetical protein
MRMKPEFTVSAGLWPGFKCALLTLGLYSPTMSGVGYVLRCVYFFP